MRVAYLLGWSGSGKTRAVRSLAGLPILRGDRFLERVAGTLEILPDRSWHDPGLWERWHRDPDVDMVGAFSAAFPESGINPGTPLLVEGTLFGWSEVIGPFQAALERLAGRGLDRRRFYLEVDAPTVAARINGRIEAGDRPGPPVSVEAIAGHLDDYRGRLARAGVFVSGRADDLAVEIRSYLTG